MAEKPEEKEVKTMKKGKEAMSNSMNWLLYWTGISGKHINWDKVEEVYGKQAHDEIERDVKIYPRLRNL